jgi:hypothetical protein
MERKRAIIEGRRAEAFSSSVVTEETLLPEVPKCQTKEKELRHVIWRGKVSHLPRLP